MLIRAACRVHGSPPWTTNAATAIAITSGMAATRVYSPAITRMAHRNSATVTSTRLIAPPSPIGSGKSEVLPPINICNLPTPWVSM